MSATLHPKTIDVYIAGFGQRSIGRTASFKFALLSTIACSLLLDANPVSNPGKVYSSLFQQAACPESEKTRLTRCD
jgi:hypothetical protein